VFLEESETARIRDYGFRGNPSVKDAIEAQGVPHPEVDAIDVNRERVGFDYQLCNGDWVAAFGYDRVGKSSSKLRLPLTDIAFVVDVNLGKLARWLRLLGFDALYTNRASDAEIAAQAADEQRIVLSRDRRLLHQRVITYGYWVRSDDPDIQIREVVTRFELADKAIPYARCLACNGLVRKVRKQDVLDRLLPKTRRYYEDFYQCGSCRKVYWQGPHLEQLNARLESWSHILKV
jgi:uncharacterized protein with PIN domain